MTRTSHRDATLESVRDLGAVVDAHNRAVTMRVAWRVLWRVVVAFGAVVAGVCAWGWR